ncbi:MAG: glutamine synthetase type III, partial [Acutalibacteraceae bacterium]
HVLPKFPKDTTDRNRTSPFAFTGNKFEFRMLGSQSSIAGTNIVLNTAVAEELKQFADELEKAEDFGSALHALIKRTIAENKNIIFNGNGYDDAWIEEATTKRGLLNLKSTPDALPHFVDEKNVKLYTSHKVFTESELYARHEIHFESYNKHIHIEALTMIDMASKDILPAVTKYTKQLSDSVVAKKSALPTATCKYEESIIEKLSTLSAEIYTKLGKLEEVTAQSETIDDAQKLSRFSHDVVIAAMDDLRASVDAAEEITSSEYWPYPSYGEMLFSVK